jgi:hypothetical protein
MLHAYTLHTFYGHVRLLASTKFPTSDHVYGLHFQKGDKGGYTYHANGYLVASNYLDITLKRLKDNFARLSTKE